MGGFFLWLAAKELPFSTVLETLDSFSFSHLATWFSLFCFVYLLSHIARVVRWFELLKPLGETDRWTSYRVCAVGFMAILLLPLRLGEFVRPLLISKTGNVSASAAMGTVVVERVLDGLIITGMLFLTLSAYSATHETTLFATSLAVISAAIFIPAFLLCLLSVWQREFANRFVRLCFFWAPSVADKVISMVDAFITGIGSLKSGGALARFLGLTGLYWLSNGLSMFLLAKFAFGFDISLWDTFTLLAVLVVGIMIPAGPGMAGNYEFFVAKGMTLFSSDVVGIAAFSATMHVLQFIVIVIPGMAILFSDKTIRTLLRDAMRADGEPTETP